MLKLILAFWTLLLAGFDPLQPAAHDPAAIQENGTWYLFCTGFGIDILTSDDLVTWTRAGHVFDTPPQWALETVPGYRGHTWAPDILFHDGLYYLYYSCSSFGKNDSAIGVATARTLDPTSPDYGWEDHGCVVRSVGGRDDWNAIDPNVFIDTDGTAWLSEPEVWFPLCSRPEGTAEDTSSTDDAIRADRRGKAFDPGNGAVEAPFIVRRTLPASSIKSSTCFFACSAVSPPTSTGPMRMPIGMVCDPLLRERFPASASVPSASAKTSPSSIAAQVIAVRRILWYNVQCGENISNTLSHLSMPDT